MVDDDEVEERAAPGFGVVGNERELVVEVEEVKAKLLMERNRTEMAGRRRRSHYSSAAEVENDGDGVKE